MLAEIVPQRLHGLEFFFDSHLIECQWRNHGSILAIPGRLAIPSNLQGRVLAQDMFRVPASFSWNLFVRKTRLKSVL
jgi:hypothetical protein